MEKNLQDLKIVFMGTPKFGAIVLEKLIRDGYKPILIITKPKSPVEITAQKHNIKISDFGFRISDLKPDLGIVAAYGQILPRNILNIPKFGFLNVHPSLLPKYRGATPVQAAILNGDTETGVSIIKMTEKVDSGEIISNSKFLISNKITNFELTKQLAEFGAELLVKTVPDYIADKIKPQPQNEAKATYTKIIKKEDGLIDWKKPAEYIEKQVRALNPWPGTYTLYNGKILKILKAEIINNKLIIKEVQPEGKKPMSFKDFFRGHNDFKIPC